MLPWLRPRFAIGRQTSKMMVGDYKSESYICLKQRSNPEFLSIKVEYESAQRRICTDLPDSVYQILDLTDMLSAQLGALFQLTNLKRLRLAKIVIRFLMSLVILISLAHHMRWRRSSKFYHLSRRIFIPHP